MYDRDDTDSGIVGALAADPKDKSADEQELLAAAEAYQQNRKLNEAVTGDEPERPARKPKRQAIDDDDEDDVTPTRRRQRDDDEDEEQDDDVDDESFDDDEDEDELDDDVEEDDEDEEYDGSDEDDDDDTEMRQRPSRGARALAKEYGIRDMRELRTGVMDIVDDFRATVQRVERTPAPNQTNTPPADTASEAFSDEDFKEFEELNPKAAKVIKGLLRQVTELKTQTISDQNRRAMRSINRQFDEIGKKYGIARELGESGRAASRAQKAARRELIQAAHDYARQRESEGKPVTLRSALRAAVFSEFYKEILGARKKQAAADKVVRLGRRRERQFDVVPTRGSTPQIRNASRGGDRDLSDRDERDLLRAASLYQKQNRVGRGR